MVALLSWSLISSKAHAINILASDVISLDVPIADKSAEEKAITLNPRAYYLKRTKKFYRKPPIFAN